MQTLIQLPEIRAATEMRRFDALWIYRYDTRIKRRIIRFDSQLVVVYVGEVDLLGNRSNGVVFVAGSLVEQQLGRKAIRIEGDDPLQVATMDVPR